LLGGRPFDEEGRTGALGAASRGEVSVARGCGSRYGRVRWTECKEVRCCDVVDVADAVSLDANATTWLRRGTNPA
jgi:hypothetical protein